VLLAELVNIAGEPHPAFAEHDQVVADAFQLRYGMGGVQHGSACLSAGLEHGTQEVSPGQRIKVGHRLIEQEQLRPLGQHQGKSPWARSPPDRALIRARGRMASRWIRSDASTVSKLPFMQRPISRTSATRSRGHSGASCATNPMRPSRRAGAPPAASTVPVMAGSKPAAMLIRVVLPEPFGPTSATTLPAGTSRLQSRRPQMPRP
jgi:hypothetical protein